MQSRNKREGLYCGTFYANGNPPKKTYRCEYGQGMFITLKEYGKRLKLYPYQPYDYWKDNAKQK